MFLSHLTCNYRKLYRHSRALKKLSRVEDVRLFFKVYVRVLWSYETPYLISPGHTALKRKSEINTEVKRKIFDLGEIWVHDIRIRTPSL